ncbi:MAG TPA: lysophospholipid acyltransferase family protein [Syntrophomonadaceae bacterium]|nr:lysophospholipid acyltransferase family protein [Syntrophomonadaceae bacterium]
MLYTVIRIIGLFLFSLLGLRREGLENLPSSGPVVVVANHISNWDPLILGFALPRPLCYMAKAELFRIPVLTWLLPKLYAFPVKRGAVDRQAIRLALDMIKDGQVLGMFPEGTRNIDQGPVVVKPGAALLALKAGCPIVPVACIGTNRVLPIGWFKPLKIVVGKAIDPDVKEDSSTHSAALKELSGKIENEINVLLRK